MPTFPILERVRSRGRVFGRITECMDGDSWCDTSSGRKYECLGGRAIDVGSCATNTIQPIVSVSLSAASVAQGVPLTAKAKVMTAGLVAIPGIVVSWRYTGASGSVVSLDNKTTDSNGECSVTIPAQSVSGEYTVYATVPEQTLNGAPVTTNWNSKAFTVTSPDPISTSLTISANQAEVSVGGHATLTGVLKQAGGTGLSGKTVKVYQSSGASTGGTLLGSATTSSTGSWNYNLSSAVFSSVGTRKFYAVYEGQTISGVTYNACTSPCASIKVISATQNITTTLTLNTPASNPVAGVAAGMSAHIATGSTSLGGLTIQLLNNADGAVLGSGVSDGYGNVVFSVKFTAAGTYSLKAKFAGATIDNYVYTPSESIKSVTVNEPAPTTLSTSIHVEPYQAPAIQGVLKVAGWFFTGEGAVPSGFKLVYELIAPNKTYKESVETNASGSFGFTVPPAYIAIPGEYTLKIYMYPTSQTINNKTYVRASNGIATGSFSVPSECLSGQVETESCFDGSTIIRRNCVDGIWVATDAACPTPECTEPLYVDCIDGTKVMVKDCITGKYYETGSECPINVGEKCTKNVTGTCPDGSTITEYECVDGKYVKTNATCPTEDEWSFGYYLRKLLAALGVS